jgi:hypothetical protein
MIAALARPPLARLLRTPRSLATVGAWCVLSLGFALSAHVRGVAHGADHVLVDAYAALLLPLLVYTLVGAVVGTGSLSASTAPLVLFGAAPARAAAVTVGVAVLTSLAMGGALAALLAVVAHGASDPPAPGDALASAYAGALGGAAYAAFFALGTGFGRRGGLRVALLLVDWVLGRGRGALAILVPRAHVRNLLGGEAPLDLSPRASALALVVIAVAFALLAVRRGSRA